MDSSTHTEAETTEEIDNSVTSVVNPGNKISTVKLGNDNFLMWKVQIEFALEGHELESYILEDTDPPSKQIKGSDNSIKPNPAFVKWKKQDRLISSWLFGSMTDGVLEQVIHCKTSRAIWKCLLQMFNSRNRAQIMRLKAKLQTIQKGNMPLTEYFSHIKRCVDALAAIGKEVDTEDHITYILGGLGSEYESMASAITAQSEDISVQEVMALLLTHENRIESRAKSINTDGSVPSANLMTQSSHTPDSDAPKQNNKFSSPSNFNNRGRGGGRSHRGGRFWNNNRNKPQCQICYKFGHTAIKCYSLAGRFPPPQSNSTGGFHPQFGAGSFPPNQQMQALLAASDMNQDNCWYPDSGATNHLTNNFGNLGVSSDYNGSNQMQVGNGAGSGHWPNPTPRTTP